MKKKIIVLLTLIIALNSLIINANAKNTPKLTAEASLLIDTTTGKYLYKDNIDQKIAPGGFTKIMTAIVAIECMVDKSETVVANGNTLAQYDYSFGHMGILADEMLTLDNLINGMLIYDAGDAAEVIAAYSMDSRDEFIKEMNNKAVKIGALNTKFTNPSGFPDKKQYSTVEDIYKITKYAMELDYFSEVVKKYRYEMEATNKYTQKRYLDNKNKFLSTTTTDKYYTSRAKGIKTSYIDDSNCGVILQYETEKMKLMSIVAGSPYDGTTNHAYEDTRKLIDYGLNYYTSVKVISEGDIMAEVELDNAKDTDRILLEANEDIYVNLPKDYDEEKLETKVVLEDNIKAPITKGKVLGSVTVIYNGEEYISASLTSPQEIKANNFKGVFKKLWRIISSPALLVTLGILLIVLVWSLLIFNKKKEYKIDRKK